MHCTALRCQPFPRSRPLPQVFIITTTNQPCSPLRPHLCNACQIIFEIRYFTLPFFLFPSELPLQAVPPTCPDFYIPIYPLYLFFHNFTYLTYVHFRIPTALSAGRNVCLVIRKEVHALITLISQFQLARIATLSIADSFAQQEMKADNGIIIPLSPLLSRGICVINPLWWMRT